MIDPFSFGDDEFDLQAARWDRLRTLAKTFLTEDNLKQWQYEEFFMDEVYVDEDEAYSLLRILYLDMLHDQEDNKYEEDY